MFGLSYTLHGGSGLGYSRADVLEMPLRDIIWCTERLRDQREAEAKQLSKK